VFLSGLMRLWLLDDGGKLIRRRARRLIAAHVNTHRRFAAPSPARGGRGRG